MIAGPDSRLEWLHPAVVFLALLALYAATAPRTVALEDDGLFIMSSYFLGIEHPPGYPLHTLLGHLFTLLPVGSVALRVHLMSAFFGALTCAVIWLCVRTLLRERLWAYFTAFGLGLSREFWSQSIIAEVYTLNTFFVFILVYLGLRLDAATRFAPGMAALMALLFGLSLSNHWPLMVLVSPAFAILLWPRRREIVRLLPVLVPMCLAGLSPYVWLVVRSWSDPVFSFYGPLNTAGEFWTMVSRAGYAAIDASASATWIDRLYFLRYFGLQLVLQFAILGAALGLLGAIVQWRTWGYRVSLCLTVIFLMPSIVLNFLLGFDYDSLYAHIFSVYPLPAYATVAIWMALGLMHLARSRKIATPIVYLVCAILLSFTAAVSTRTNLRAAYDWSSRYAHAILTSLPKDAILFVSGDAEVGAVGYFHLVEGARPDITLMNPRGLGFFTRIYHPLRTRRADGDAAVATFAQAVRRPVAFTPPVPEGIKTGNHWLYYLVSSPDHDGETARPRLDETQREFLETAVLSDDSSDPWTSFVQRGLRRRIAALLAMTPETWQTEDPNGSRYVERLDADYDGALGIAIGMLANPRGYNAADVARQLARAAYLMPGDLAKNDKAMFFELRGHVRLELGDRGGALRDLKAAVELHPPSTTRSASTLARLSPQGTRLDD
jgi:hypothetical protein